MQALAGRRTRFRFKISLSDIAMYQFDDFCSVLGMCPTKTATVELFERPGEPPTYFVAQNTKTIMSSNTHSCQPKSKPKYKTRTKSLENQAVQTPRRKVVANCSCLRLTTTMSSPLTVNFLSFSSLLTGFAALPTLLRYSFFNLSSSLRAFEPSTIVFDPSPFVTQRGFLLKFESKFRKDIH